MASAHAHILELLYYFIAQTICYKRFAGASWNDYGRQMLIVQYHNVIGDVESTIYRGLECNTDSMLSPKTTCRLSIFLYNLQKREAHVQP